VVRLGCVNESASVKLALPRLELICISDELGDEDLETTHPVDVIPADGAPPPSCRDKEELTKTFLR
jgi:hypothetical protein